MRSILVVTKEEEVFGVIRDLYHSSFKVAMAPGREAAIQSLHHRRCDFLFLDMEILGEGVPVNGFKSALHSFWEIFPTIEIVVMARPEMIREAVMAVKAGASNYLTYPLHSDEVKYVIECINESVLFQSELDYLRDQFWDADFLDYVQTQCRGMRSVLEKIRSVAPTKSTVTLLGETGTGKGVLAKVIHRHSNRREAQFISVHCGAIPDTLLESELFGHEKGAFTGAVRRKLGKFEIAKGGTIFLDEIGTLTPSAQIKLLQILQDGTFQRIGGEGTLECNVRVIAASNADLKKMCDEGLFRKDLYYRLNVFPIEIPPLRERIEDIPHFVNVFLRRMNRFSQKDIHHVDPRILEAFQNYHWPGNIRELENLIERACILEKSSTLTPESFPSELFESSPANPAQRIDASLTLRDVRNRGIKEIEKKYLREQLAIHGGRIKDSAVSAGITTRQLHKLMKKYGLRKEDFK